MSTTKYYLVENGKQVGPFSFEELKSKSVVKETLVWFDGLDKWTRAEKIAELSSLLPKNPPPVTEVDDSNIKENVPPIPSIDVSQQIKLQVILYLGRLSYSFL